MWCEHCQQDVSPSRSPVSGLEQCPECGNEFETTDLSNQSIAQTAHALLKRWEESRQFEEPQQAPQADFLRAEAPVIPALVERAAPEQKPLLSQELSPPQPVTMRPAVPPKIAPAPKLEPQAKLPEKTHSQPQPVRPEATIPAPRPAPVVSSETPVSQPAARRSFGTPPTPPQKKAAQNDASGLIARAYSRDRKASMSESKAPRSTPQPAVAPKADLVTAPPSRPTAQTRPEGRVQLGERPVVPQASLPDTKPASRPKKNFSAIFGQFLVLCSALGMTGGLGIVILNRFGASIQFNEATGWLTFAGSHLLFVLGVYTNLSSRMEQVLNDVHSRYDELTKVIAYQQALTESNRKNQAPESPAPSAGNDNSFERSPRMVAREESFSA